MRPFIGFLFLLFCLPQTVQAADFQVWNAAATTFTPKESRPTLTGWFDLHTRRGSDSTVLIVRPAVGVAATKWLVVHAGYAWVPTFAEESAVHEHRSWQQGIIKGQTPTRIALQSRTRFEQRFRSEGDVGLRLRQFVRVGWHAPGSKPAICGQTSIAVEPSNNTCFR